MDFDRNCSIILDISMFYKENGIKFRLESIPNSFIMPRFNLMDIFNNVNFKKLLILSLRDENDKKEKEEEQIRFLQSMNIQITYEADSSILFIIFL